jgi:hypothetical protein
MIDIGLLQQFFAVAEELHAAVRDRFLDTVRRMKP